MPDGTPPRSRFEEEAQAPRVGLLRELWGFLKHNKKWWLGPILVVLLGLAALAAASAFVGGTGLAPFIYPLF